MLRPRYRHIVPSLLLVAGCAALPAKNSAPSKQQAPLEEYFKIGRAGERITFSADETTAAFLSDQGGRLDIWARPLAGGPARQVTHTDGFIDALAFSPTDDLLAFEADHGGDELPHLYLTDKAGAPARDLVPNLPTGRRTAFTEWAADGKTLLYQANVDDEKELDMYEYTVATGQSALVWKAIGGEELQAVSRDHRLFVVSQQRTDADNDLLLIRRDSPQKREPLTPHPGAVRHVAQYLSADDHTLFFTSDAGGEFNALFGLNLATHAIHDVAKTEWNIEAAAASNSGRYALYSSNADGLPQLVVTDTRTGAPVTLPAPPAHGAWDPTDETTGGGPATLGFSPSDRYLGVMLRSDVTPATPYALDLQEGRAIALAQPLPESLRQQEMVAGVAVRVPSFDGRPVPAFLYVPPGPGPFPAVIEVHGGPNSQTLRDFSRLGQYLVSKGYAVLEPNVRGSTGYGKTWAGLDNHDLGGGPLKDIVACKRYLVARAHVAADKVVVMGGSYGGYMALAAATFTPDEFAANIDEFGISDIKSLVEGFPAYWLVASPLLYKKWGNPTDPRDAAYQHDRSPLYFADRVTRPLLVVQGENDARVKQAQSERIVAALRARHVPVHYLLLKGEGHGFSKNASRLQTYRLIDRFLDHYVAGKRSVPVD